MLVREANERLVMATLDAQTLTDVANQANRLKDEFLAVVSHELRTPLNAVLGWARMLGSGQLTSTRAAHAIGTIERNAGALARIIDDLLDVSRIVAGTLQVERHSVDLTAVVTSAVDVLQPVAAAKNMVIQVTATEASVEPVTGDASRLQQVVENLLSNAIKFSPDGGSVHVVVQRVGPSMEIRVADTGQGISPEFLPHVFERFRQADNGITRRHGGLGLGLAIVSRLVEIHGGTVRALSGGVNQGATFIVSLPVMRADYVGKRLLGPNRGAPVVAFSGKLQRLGGIRVMIVEDDDDGRELIAIALEEAGATIIALTTVHEALEQLSAFHPDMLVSDIGLPDEDGYALIRQIREREAIDGGLLPAVAITGFARADDRDHALAAGFQVHVPKPVDPAELTRVIAGLVVRQG